MTVLDPGAVTIEVQQAKAAGLCGAGASVTIGVGPITGGTPPYSVNFSNVESFGSDATFRKVDHAIDASLFNYVSVAGDGILEGGSAYATGRLSDEFSAGGILYFPPSCYVIVEDSDGQSATLRLGQGGLKLNLNGG
jgi:hypothetical protein